MDVTHAIPAQDIRAGAFILSTVYRDFPLGTVHLAVVDPGVGTHRKPLAIWAAGRFFVGPDNGLFSPVLCREPGWKARSPDNPDYWRLLEGPDGLKQVHVSPTFHGRDIFAPVAAHLARGVPLEVLGVPCAPVISPWSMPTADGEGLLGEIIHIDHFGNAITNVTRDDLEALDRGLRGAECVVRIGGAGEGPAVRMARTYGETAPGAMVALWGSSGHLEIAVNRGSAARELGLGPGSKLTVAWRGFG